MGRMKKEFNRDGVFQARFRDQFNEKCKSQGELAEAIGVSRPTVAGWLDGRNIPDILSLTKMAQFFNVSADYLLGLSDTASPDVNVKAAMEYTGLSEEAVERLHDGFDYPIYYEFNKSDIEKKSALREASTLISTHVFEDIISSLGEVRKWAFLEMALLELHKQYNVSLPEEAFHSYCFSDEDCDRITEELLQIFDTEGFYVPEYRLDDLKAKIEEGLDGDGLLGVLNIRESLDRNQFLVSKAIMGYLDQLVKESHQRARQKLCR